MRYKIGDLVFDEQISKYIIVVGYSIKGYNASEGLDKIISIFYDGILYEEEFQDFDFDEFVQLKYRIKL